MARLISNSLNLSAGQTHRIESKLSKSRFTCRIIHKCPSGIRAIVDFSWFRGYVPTLPLRRYPALMTDAAYYYLCLSCLSCWHSFMHVAIEFSGATFLSYNSNARMPVPDIENGADFSLPNRVAGSFPCFAPTVAQGCCGNALRTCPRLQTRDSVPTTSESRLSRKVSQFSFLEPLQKVSRARCRPSSAGKLRPSPSSNNSSEGYEGYYSLH